MNHVEQIVLRIILLIIGSFCVGMWALEKLSQGIPPGRVSIPPASTPVYETSPSLELSPTPAQESSPTVAVQSAAPITEVPVGRTELVPEKSVAPGRALPAFVRLKEPITFQPDSSKNRSTTLAVPIGAKVRVVRVNGSWIWIEKGGNNTYIPMTATDFKERMASTFKDEP